MKIPNLNLKFLNFKASHEEFIGTKKSQSFRDDFYYREIADLTEAGGWSVNFVTKRSFFDAGAKRILKVPEGYKPSLKEGYRFYAKEHLEMATSLFFACAQGTPFDTEIKMQTYDGEGLWVRAKGRPLRDESGEILGIQGVFQNIDKVKEHEEQLEESLKIIKGHNERLYDFAHILSHNLRSQVSNLQMSAALFEDLNLNEEQKELLSNFIQIGDNLDKTLKHLNKIISAHNMAQGEREVVVFQEVYDRINSGLTQIIKKNRVVIYTDFSEVEEILYIEAYLESIVQNLLTNAIKYKHSDRDPEIHIFTCIEDEKKYLVVRDNGLGIDLEKYGGELFKLYRTFHNNEDAQGLGLFLIRNEVEAMGGEITVESIVNQGSKFTVKLN